MNEHRGTNFKIFIPAIFLSLLVGAISWMLSFFILLAAVMVKSWYDFIRPALPGSKANKPITEEGKKEESLLKVNRLYSLLSALNQMIVRTRDEESLFREVCQIAIDVGKFRMAWIGLKHKETNEIVPQAFSGFEMGYLSQIKITDQPGDPNGQGPTGTAFKSGKCVVCHDISSDPKMSIWKKEAIGRGYYSSISLPIFKLKEIAGVFTIYATLTHFFDDMEVQLMVQAAADVSFALDVLEKDKQRNAAEEEVVRSEKRYHTLAEISPVGIFHAAADGTTTYVNPKWSEIAGIAVDQALGHQWTNAVHPEDREKVQEGWKELTLGKSQVLSEFRFLRSDGTIAWVIAQSAADYDAARGTVGFVGTITDITNRKQAEEEMENNERRFRALIENSTDGLTVLARDGVVLDMGPSGKRILGYDAEAIVGKARADLIHPDDFPKVHNAFIEVMKFPGQIETIEYRHIMPNCESKWLECSFNNLLDKPYLNAVVLNYRDITARKHAELQIKESEDKYRQAQAIGKLGHWELDLVSDKLYWSDEIYSIFGLGKNEFGNRYESFLATVHPDDRVGFEKAQRELLAGTKSMDVVHRIIIATGEVKYVHEIAAVTTDESGRVIRLTGTVQDITLLIKARNEILLEKQLSDSVINSLPGIFYLYTREGHFLRWNNNFELVTGYTAGEIMDMQPLDFFDAGEKEMMAETIEEVFRQGKSSAEARFHLKNRQKIPYYFTGRAIEYDGRRCLIGVGIDISVRVSAQEQMTETSEQLRQLAAHLQDIREEERVSMAREIHDELGQQLTGLKMDIYWLKDELTPAHENIEAQLAVILKLIDQTINTVRKIASALRPSILDDLGIEEALKSYCREFQDRFGLTVSCKIDLAGIQLPPKISISLFRIVQESLTNIARHAEASNVYVSLLVVNENLELLIRDNGKGFDLNAISGKKTLGLLGIRERVYVLEGDYRVHSLPGAGTAISVSIQLSKIRTNP